MNKISKISKQDLIDRLVTIALFSGKGKSGEVGYYIKRLNKHDKEIVQQLTANDFNHRIK